MIRVTCTSCQKPLSIDESKLPMHEVAFPCPGCQARVTVDRRNLATPENALAAAAEPPEDDDSYSERALVIGGDAAELRALLRGVGLRAVAAASAEAAREIYLRDFPAVVIFSPEAMSPPPLAEFAPMMSLSPADRRRGFYILIADNLRTLDGNAAFLYQVNLVVAKKDLSSFPKIYREAIEDHKRVYAALRAIGK